MDWQYQRKSADKCIRYLAGVTDVNNHIFVKPIASQAAVKGEIEAALVRNAELDSEEIRVDVRGDRVTLRGTVQSWLERQRAEEAAWGSPGVADVENLISVNPIRHGTAVMN